MKRFKIAKVLSLALSFVFALSIFTVTSVAHSNPGEAYKRALTNDEIATIATIFDAEYYAKQCPDVVDAFGTKDANVMFAHFINSGLWEKRQPNAELNIDVYATRNVQLHKQLGNDIVAYYVYYANHPEERANLGVCTLGDAARRRAAVYSVYDFVVGQEQPRAGAWKVQSENEIDIQNSKNNK